MWTVLALKDMSCRGPEQPKALQGPSQKKFNFFWVGPLVDQVYS